LSQTRPHRFAFPALLIGNVALSFGPWLVRLADVGPVAAGFWRLALALPLLWIVAVGAGQRPHWPRKPLVIIVLIGAIFYALDLAAWNAGIPLTKLGNATLFGNSGSFVFAIYGLFLVRRLPSVRQTAALLMAFAGAALLMSSSYELSPRNLVGDLLALGAGFLYGGYLVFVERARSGLQPMPLLLLSTAFSVPLMLVISAALGETLWPHDWTPLILFAVSSQVIGQGLLVYAIGYLPPLVVGLGLLTQPIISGTVGWLAYGEGLSLTDAIGAIAIAAAIVLVRLPERGLPVADDQPS